MILELDVGNSRIKWRVLNRDAQAGDRHPGALMGGAEDAAVQTVREYSARPSADSGPRVQRGQ